MPKETNQYRKLYSKAWNRLEHITPLPRDCGELCDKICCGGSVNDGMLLFPGEEFLYEDAGMEWFHIKDSNMALSDGYKIKLLVCDGECPREMRPLSCRIFPLTPYINIQNRVEFRLDLRSPGICPIIFRPDDNPVQDEFIDSLYRTFPPLLKDSRIVEFIGLLTAQYDEMASFLEKFQR